MNNRPINVLSLFGGIECALVALQKNGVQVDRYFSSEVDRYAIQITQKNHPEVHHIGDVRNIHGDEKQEKPQYIFVTDDKGTITSHFTGGIDLLIGGSPCQDLSIAKANRKGLDGDRSSLFWEYVRVLRETKPKWFILENVASMPQEAKDIITKEMGVEPIMINAALVSAQNRKRLFWTNIPNVTLPEDRGIYLKDIILDGTTEDLKSLCITATYSRKSESDYRKRGTGQMIQIGNIGTNAQAHRVYSPEGKSCTLSALGGGQGAKTGLYITQRPRGKNNGNNHHEKSPTVTSSRFEQNNHLQDGEMLRKLHPIECERLQGLPDNYTEGVSNTQRYKMIGNGFNVDVIAHILTFIPVHDNEQVL